MTEAGLYLNLALQDWVHRLSEEDRKKMAHTFRIDSNPREFLELIKELRQRYDFIPPEVEPDGRSDKTVH